MAAHRSEFNPFLSTPNENGYTPYSFMGAMKQAEKTGRYHQSSWKPKEAATTQKVEQKSPALNGEFSLSTLIDMVLHPSRYNI